MDKEKILILRELFENLEIEVRTSVRFSLLCKNLAMSKPVLDKHLNELQNERYIDQDVLVGYDEFILVLKEKALDVELDDEEFVE